MRTVSLPEDDVAALPLVAPVGRARLLVELVPEGWELRVDPDTRMLYLFAESRTYCAIFPVAGCGEARLYEAINQLRHAITSDQTTH